MNEITNYSEIISEIKEVLQASRLNVARQVNDELLIAYWNIGRIIVEYEQNSKDRAAYGQQTLKELSKALTKEFGKGFSRANIYNMRLFYLTYKKIQSVTGKLTWTHYCELLSISDADKRSFYEKEAINSGWSVREMKRQMATSLYERLLLSDGKTNKETVLALAQHGIEMSSPTDIMIEETGEAVDNGLAEVYVNTAVNDGSTIAELMECFMQEQVDNKKFPLLSNRVWYYKNED